MSSFTKPLIVEITEESWRGRMVGIVYSEFQYHVGSFPSTDVITVPVGFKTDGCSIPAIVRWWLRPWDKQGKAGVVHDWVLREGIRSQEECADIFLEAMTVLGVSRLKRYAMYFAVKYWPFAEPI